MNYWPTFLNPWAAAAAGAIVIPSLLVLYFLKLRRREMPVSSTLLWKKAVQDLQVNAPFQKLRRNLLLFLQLLIVLLCIFALLGPRMPLIPGATIPRNRVRRRSHPRSRSPTLLGPSDGTDCRSDDSSVMAASTTTTIPRNHGE